MSKIYFIIWSYLDGPIRVENTNAFIEKLIAIDASLLRSRRLGNLGSIASPFPLSLRGALATKQSQYEIATPAFGGLAMTSR
jgi:hypothetical protein